MGDGPATIPIEDPAYWQDPHTILRAARERGQLRRRQRVPAALLARDPPRPRGPLARGEVIPADVGRGVVIPAEDGVRGEPAVLSAFLTDELAWREARV